MASTLAGLLKGTQGSASAKEDKSLYFDQTTSFTKLGLDRRLFKAVAKTGYIYPSLVQTSTIPLILEGRDVLVRARTGTGKTAAYLLPVLHQILEATADTAADGAVVSAAAASAAASSASAGVRAIILVPTRDLCDQVRDSVRTFTHYAREAVTCVTLNADSKRALTLEASQLKLNPNLIVATPGRLLQHLAAGTLSVKASLRTLVVDEADLVLSYGYEDDVKALNGHFPEFFQCVLMSATLTPELDALKALLLHNPAVVKLDEGGGDKVTSGALAQYFMLCPQQDKLLLLYVHAALGIFKGKTLFFVNSVADAFHLKLFLEQFSINAAVLNDDLPYNSRRNIVLQFNRGVFDYLIATDLCSDEVDVAEEQRVESAVRMQVFSDASAAGRKGVDLTKTAGASHGGVISDSDSDGEGDDDSVEVKPEPASDDVAVKAEVISDSDSDSDSDDDSDDDEEEIAPKGKKARAAFEVAKAAKAEAKAAKAEAKAAKKAAKKEAKKEEAKKEEHGSLRPSSSASSADSLLPTPASQLPTQRAGESEEAFLARLEASEASRRARGADATAATAAAAAAATAGSVAGGARAGAAAAGATGRSSDRVGATRGIDFVDVQTVVNVDFPLTAKAYTHRIGRTARAGKSGQAVSYVAKDEQPLLEAVMEAQSVVEVGGVVTTKEPELKPLPFALESANSFRYRVEECRRKITATAVKEARLAAIRAEMINSDRLRTHFEDNPHELALLKHNKALTSRSKVNRHLNYVPEYLIPAEFRALGVAGGKVELGASGGGLSSKAGRRHRMKVDRKRGRELDPLQSFSYDSAKHDANKGFKAKEREEYAKKKKMGKYKANGRVNKDK